MELFRPHSRHSWLLDDPPSGFQPSAQKTIEYHDQRSQQVKVGIDPTGFSNMVTEARSVIQEPEEKLQGLEHLAQEDY